MPKITLVRSEINKQCFTAVMTEEQTSDGLPGSVTVLFTIYGVEKDDIKYTIRHKVDGTWEINDEDKTADCLTFLKENSIYNDEKGIYDQSDIEDMIENLYA